jgi:hypothetical protein
MFGRFIHHKPDSYFGRPLKSRSTTVAVSIARQDFGRLSKNWGPDANRRSKCCRR